MLKKLESVYQNFNGASKIGNLMKEFAAFFKFYFEYCNNYNQSMKLFGQLKKVIPQLSSKTQGKQQI